MGLEEDCEEDRWEYDASNASWTRFIVVPRKDFFHPSEGAGEESSGPKLSDLRNCRWTFPEGIAAIKDDWKKDSGELEVDGSPMEWTGKCVFYERWTTEEEENQEESRLHLEMQGMERMSRGSCQGHATSSPLCSLSGGSALPGDLIFHDIPERNITDDLSGKPLEVVQVTSAKHEELTEMYRRQVWVERSTEECLQKRGSLQSLSDGLSRTKVMSSILT